ncbi:MAG: hypothetical protein K2X27_23125 [Candidatus Obscuribacterales bacterium]|nr:hypothetical protein [Candidatus Obscuribacterales bacterium]
MDNFWSKTDTAAAEISGLEAEWLDRQSPLPALRAESRQEQSPERKPRQEAKDIQDELKFDYVHEGRISILSSITLPDGGKITRCTEPLPGRDGKEGGFQVLKGYTLPNGNLLEREIYRNADGSISLVELDPENRNPDRKSIRMSQAEFIKFIKELR